MAMADNDWLLVAALDFGTTYSGYAFSFRDSPNEIQTPQTWYAGSTQLASMKTPTCLLLNPDKTFDSFGYEAQNKYSELATEGNHREYFYFEHFKMILHHDEQLSRKTILEDVLGKSVLAIEVFSMSIEYLKNHLMETLKNRITDVTLSDVRFVLTVPAIWRDSAKEFMREAAEKAGIALDKLILALEPEAASIHCQNIPTDKLSIGANLSIADKGTHYLIADIGGGTGDFTVHEKLSSGKLTEVSKASGGAYGGINVDNKYLQFISNVIGAQALQQLKSEDMFDYFDLLRDFEIKKRTITEESQKNYFVRLSTKLQEFASKNNPNFRENVENQDYLGHVNFMRDKLKIDATFMKSFLEECVHKITNHIEGILQSFPSVKHILLVGGFGECRILQERIRNCFPEKGLIIPQDCGLAVVKGAVLYGHDPRIISERMLRYTYGADVNVKFNPCIHSEDRKYVDDYGITRCKGSFRTLINAGEKITSNGLEITANVVAPTKDQSEIKYRLLYTEESNVVYMNDGCKLLGEVVIPLTGSKHTRRKCVVSFTFGLTEIHFKVTEKNSGRITEAKFDVLG